MITPGRLLFIVLKMVEGNLVDEQVEIQGKNMKVTESMEDFDYEGFLKLLREPSCRPIVTMIKNFIAIYTKEYRHTNNHHLSTIYHDFIEKVMSAVNSNLILKDKYEYSLEGIEYLLMNQLHRYAFSPAEDRDRDSRVSKKFSLYSEWISPAHLGVSDEIVIDEDALREAIDEFRSINEYLTPRDKMTGLLNGCKIV